VQPNGRATRRSGTTGALSAGRARTLGTMTSDLPRKQTRGANPARLAYGRRLPSARPSLRGQDGRSCRLGSLDLAQMDQLMDMPLLPP